MLNLLLELIVGLLEILLRNNMYRVVSSLEKEGGVWEELDYTAGIIEG